MINKIKSTLFLLCFCILQSLFFNSHAQKSVSGFYTHEYLYMSISYQEKNCCPLHFNVMREANDTLILNVTDMKSLVMGICTKSYIYDECQNEDVFYQVYGKRNEVAKAFFLFTSNFECEFYNKCNKKTYIFDNETRIDIDYLKIAGLFANYYPEPNRTTIPYLDQNMEDKLNYVCPFEILFYKKVEDLKVVINNI